MAIVSGKAGVGILMKHDKASPPPVQVFFFFRYISYRFVRPSTNDLKAIVELSMCIKTVYLYSYLSNYVLSESGSVSSTHSQCILFSTLCKN